METHITYEAIDRWQNDNFVILHIIHDMMINDEVHDANDDVFIHKG